MKSEKWDRNDILSIIEKVAFVGRNAISIRSDIFQSRAS
jgi:hypothetical protein